MRVRGCLTSTDRPLESKETKVIGSVLCEHYPLKTPQVLRVFAQRSSTNRKRVRKERTSKLTRTPQLRTEIPLPYSSRFSTRIKRTNKFWIRISGKLFLRNSTIQFYVQNSYEDSSTNLTVQKFYANT